MDAQQGEKGEGLLTVDDVAMACNVSDKTIRRWMKVKYIAYTLVGPAKRIRISRAEMERVRSGKAPGDGS